VRPPLRTPGQLGAPPARRRSRARTGPSALAAAPAATPACAVPAQAAAPGSKPNPAPNGRHLGHIPPPGAIPGVGPVTMGGWGRPPDAPGIGIDRDLDAADDLWVA
jgi:L-alanine-DL-glutamate epimerase-like enolase superfamily enzyme